MHPRVLYVLQLIVFLAMPWMGLRNILFPDGTSTVDVLIMFLLLCIWEDVARTKRRQDEILDRG